MAESVTTDGRTYIRIADEGLRSRNVRQSVMIASVMYLLKITSIINISLKPLQLCDHGPVSP